MITVEERAKIVNNIETKVAEYEKMKNDYSDQMTAIENKLDYLLDEEGISPRSARIAHLESALSNMCSGYGGIVNHLEALKERLEDAKNDPNYDHENWYSSKAKSHYRRHC